MRDSTFTDEYYEQAWSQIASSISSQEEERIEQTLSLIPGDSSSILDVGCGDGRITNRLNSLYSKVVGLESSREALRHVKVEKILGSVDSLPFPNKSFDLILCCEVLEHLPFRVYPGAIEEIQRVAAKYIIVTVPNNEDLGRSSVVCPHCSCVFNVSRHVRSFNQERLKGLFSQFGLQSLQFCLPVKVYPSFLIKGAKFTGLLPKNPFPTTALCPQCGYSSSSSGEASLRAITSDRDRLSVRLLRPLARRLIPTKKRGTWLIALYQRG
ncbi:MAG: class I SAM-dependent methyltransferase [Dehalococcoidia bacterium]|nr:class I SAM-dependent methyltransferase [Dehalococcoidia bacterium]